MVIANERYGRGDIKAAILKHVDAEFAVADRKSDAKFAVADRKSDAKFADLHTELEFTQGLMLDTAVKAMKAIDGDKTELREFIAQAEKILRCIKLSEDCQEGGK